MSKTLNLNHNVRVKLTEYGLREYINANPWKKEDEIIANGMWIDEQMWVVLSTLNTFANGGRDKSFTEMVIEDCVLEETRIPGEDTEIEKLAIWAVDLWLGKHYTDNMIRRIDTNPKRPNYVLCGYGNILVIEYKPAAEKGRYHVSSAFGVTYPKPDNKTRSLRQIKNMLYRNVKSQPERYRNSGNKIANDICDWCDGRNYQRADYDALVARAEAWGNKSGAKQIRKMLAVAAEYMEKAEAYRRNNPVEA